MSLHEALQEIDSNKISLAVEACWGKIGSLPQDSSVETMAKNYPELKTMVDVIQARMERLFVNPHDRHLAAIGMAASVLVLSEYAQTKHMEELFPDVSSAES